MLELCSSSDGWETTLRLDRGCNEDKSITSTAKLNNDKIELRQQITWRSNERSPKKGGPSYYCFKIKRLPESRVAFWKQRWPTFWPCPDDRSTRTDSFQPSFPRQFIKEARKYKSSEHEVSIWTEIRWEESGLKMLSKFSQWDVGQAREGGYQDEMKEPKKRRDFQFPHGPC